MAPLSRIFISGVLTALACVSLTPAWAIKDPAGVRQEREQIRQEIKDLAKEIENTNDEKEKAKKLIALLDKRLEQSKDRLVALDKDRRDLERETSKLRSQERELSAQLNETEARLGEVMRNQYRRQDINPTQAWLSGQSASRAARESYWYEQVSEAERSLALQQKDQANRLQTLREGLEAKQDKLDKTIADQSKRERELKSQRTERRQVMADLDSQLKNQELKKKRLERDETRLTGVIEELTKAIELARKRQEEQRKAAQSAAKNTPRPNLPPVPDSGDFAKLKGRLTLPVEGTVTGKFGQTRESGGSGPAWKGIFIESIEGKAVLAAGSGRIVFAEWLRGFGEIVIIDHGDQYLSVYGNNDRLLKSAGDNVKRGDKIAEVGNSSGNLSTGLYFELRHQGKPFDPLSWTP